MKKRLNKNIFCYRFLGILSIVLLVSSCKTKQDSGSVAMQHRNNQELISAVVSNTVEYDKFSAKLNIELKPGQRHPEASAPASLRIIKGKAMMLSFQIPVLSVELFKMVVTPDSILIIDRKSKVYVSEAIESVSDALNFTFEYQNLEALFTNQLFIAGKTNITPDDYRSLQVKQEEYAAHISFKDMQGLIYTFTSDYTDRVRKTEIESANKFRRMSWAYDDFAVLQNNKIFPLKMNMILTLPSDEARMNLSYSKIELNGDFSIDLSIPRNYRRITLSDAVKIINNL